MGGAVPPTHLAQLDTTIWSAGFRHHHPHRPRHHQHHRPRHDDHHHNEDFDDDHQKESMNLQSTARLGTQTHNHADANADAKPCFIVVYGTFHLTFPRYNSKGGFRQGIMLLRTDLGRNGLACISLEQHLCFNTWNVNH